MKSRIVKKPLTSLNGKKGKVVSEIEPVTDSHSKTSESNCAAALFCCNSRRLNSSAVINTSSPTTVGVISDKVAADSSNHWNTGIAGDTNNTLSDPQQNQNTQPSNSKFNSKSKSISADSKTTGTMSTKGIAPVAVNSNNNRNNNDDNVNQLRSSNDSHKLKRFTSIRSRPSKPNGLSRDDDPSVARMYDSIPLLEVTKLPRGGIIIETEAIGRVQFGIPPETIKDSMHMGIVVPVYYIVPVERFCREMGPALGVNLAEFEFPAYYNFFLQKRRCTLIVDSEDAERNIRRVFSETLLGPAQFRRKDGTSIRYDPEDFASDFNVEAIPDFEKELKHFRVMPNGEELGIETLLNFCHFEQPFDTRTHQSLGVPPPFIEDEKKSNTKEEDMNAVDMEKEVTIVEKKSKPSAYSRIKLCAEVAVIYPEDAASKDIANKTCKRVEIFKMQGGEDYVIHDINEENIIVGKIKFSGNVRVSESMSVHGFGGDGDDDIEDEYKTMIPKTMNPPTFYPPSFGVTVLGNSHGFDASGSVSGYVLWINGRGVMIDPPPYSSATLEREGIRPRTIVGIILTHCHADHDAGAFQKVLTGSPVVVITTPTIYKSFIRKYAALSNLSPALLRHSHRHKPAIIGTPLRFQGATFHFTYTLHSIPCVGFRVEWRGRSMVFTGDHFNSPPDIDKLQDSGVLSKARADDLRNLPLQHTDLLLHEAGVPPLHTPLDVLLKLPKQVKERLYVVHTQAIPPDCELRVAPTGTAGTIRLDERDSSVVSNSQSIAPSSLIQKVNINQTIFEDDLEFQTMWNSSEYESTYAYTDNIDTIPKGRINTRRSIRLSGQGHFEAPKVALRPTSSTDAWFTLNLLSAVPFLSSLSYSSTMEVLETARVDAFCKNEIVVPASRRSEVLCVVWEGTCMERPNSTCIEEDCNDQELENSFPISNAVWYAGDWTGPISLQPEKHLSGESDHSSTHDIVAMSQQGVKAISIEFPSLHRILKNGSHLYRTYLKRKREKEIHEDDIPECLETAQYPDLYIDAFRNLEVLDLLEYNSTLKKLSAVQKRHLESLAEGPKYFAPGERLWRLGAQVENAFIVVGGSVSFIAKRRNAGSAAGVDFNQDLYEASSNGSSIGDLMRRDCIRVRQELRNRKADSQRQSFDDDDENFDDELSLESSLSSESEGIDLDLSIEKVGGNIDLCIQESSQDSIHSFDGSIHLNDFEKLSIGLLKRAENFMHRDSISSSADASHFDSVTDDDDFHEGNRTMERRRSSRDRNVNRQLHRLYKGRAFTAGLVFSKGHFLGDISKMVAGLLSSTYHGKDNAFNGDDNSAKYGFGENNEGNQDTFGGHVNELTIHEQEGDQHIVHSSTLAAGKDGCLVLVFPKPSLILFLDEYPGLLLSLLGTQVVL